MMLTVFLAAFGLGLLFSAAPGAIFAETVKVAVRGGFRPALAVQIGSLVGDALWAVLGLAGVGLLLQLEELRMPIGLAGVAYLLWLSYDSWRKGGTQFSVDAGGVRECTRQAARSGVLLSITNPQNIVYWAALTYRACAVAFLLLALSSLRDVLSTNRNNNEAALPGLSLFVVVSNISDSQLLAILVQNLPFVRRI